MAEALWRALGGSAESAGVSAWSGQPAAPHAKTAVRAFGASLDSHRARNLDEVASDPDLILTMTRGQCQWVVERRPEWADRTFSLGEWIGEAGDIQDPVGQDLSAYQHVADQLYRLLVRLKEKLSAEPHS